MRIMANRASRGRGHSRGSRTRDANVWTTLLVEDNTLAPGAAVSFDIVADTDWKPSSGTSRATLMRVRGWLSIINKFSSGSFAGGPVFNYIGVFDEDVSSPNGSLASTYTDEDILWTDGHHYPFTDSGASVDSYQKVIDVKAMRKIKNGQEIRIVISNTLSVTLAFSLVLRGLLRRGSS